MAVMIVEIHNTFVKDPNQDRVRQPMRRQDPFWLASSPTFQ